MTVVTDAEGAIDRDFRCAGCEYNLRGLSIDGRCPECGLRIEQSISAARDLVPSRILIVSWRLAMLLVLECLAAIGAGAFAFGRPWASTLIAVLLTAAAWGLSIAVFLIVAWIHRERQPVALRWGWLARYIGLITCSLALASAGTRVAFASKVRPLAAIGFLEMLPIAVSPIPSVCIFAICKRCRWTLLAWTHLVVAFASALLATWCGYEVFDEVLSMRGLQGFTSLPVAGVDYATVTSPIIELLLSGFPQSMRTLAVLTSITRPIWILLMVYTVVRFTREHRRRLRDVDERTPANSRS